MIKRDILQQFPIEKPKDSMYKQIKFIFPLLLLPNIARIFAFYRYVTYQYWNKLLVSFVIGSFQDISISQQLIVLIQVLYIVLGARNDNVYINEQNHGTFQTFGITFCSYIRVILVFMCFIMMTFPYIIDICLQSFYEPRLSRGILQLVFNYSSHFASSIMTPQVLSVTHIIVFILYLFLTLWWTLALEMKRIELPILRCIKWRANFYDIDQYSLNNDSRRQTSQDLSKLKSCLLQILQCIIVSTFSQSIFLCCIIFFLSFNATILCSDNGLDVYRYSNTIYYIETEPLFHALLQDKFTGSVVGSDLLSPAYLNQILGSNEVYQVSDDLLLRSKYPFWRNTTTFQGTKRFELKRSTINHLGKSDELRQDHYSNTSGNIQSQNDQSPDIIVINLESWRSLEIGVLGGRRKKKLFGETVTPYFDALSATGVLFRQHYTPAIQTSRTLLSTLFGILPSYSKDTAIAKYKTQLQLTGIPGLLRSLRNYETVFWSATSLDWEGWSDFLTSTAKFDRLYDENDIISLLTEEQHQKLTDSNELDYFSWGVHDGVSFQALENYLTTRVMNAEQQNADEADIIKRKPLFLNVYSVSSHDPFVAPESHVATSLYASYVNDWTEDYCRAINYVDKKLGDFISSVRDKGLLDNTIVIIQGDHGNGRMEHGQNPSIASSGVYEEATHVPFLLLADDLLYPQYKGMVVDDLTSHVDLLSTIADILELRNFPQHSIGQSMLRKYKHNIQYIGSTQYPIDSRAIILENPLDGGVKGVRYKDTMIAAYSDGNVAVYNLTNDIEELYPVELKQAGNTIEMDSTELSNQTTALLHYMNVMVDTITLLYETNGFQPKV